MAPGESIFVMDSISGLPALSLLLDSVLKRQASAVKDQMELKLNFKPRQHSLKFSFHQGESVMKPGAEAPRWLSHMRCSRLSISVLFRFNFCPQGFVSQLRPTLCSDRSLMCPS